MENIDHDEEGNTNKSDTPDEKEDETELPEENEIADENMNNNTAKDGEGAEDPDAPRIIEDQ